MLRHFQGMAGNEKRGEPGAKGVKFYNDEEAIEEFTEFLKTMPGDDENMKVVYYNRGTVYNNLGQHDKALKDGEECMKIDPHWAKGYECKGWALAGMGRPKEAVKTFLDGMKMCENVASQETEELVKLIERFKPVIEEDLAGDLKKFDRRKKEKYCVTCGVFEKDIPQLDDGKFISCDKCNMVNYCSEQHRENATHDEVCGELWIIGNNLEEKSNYNNEILHGEVQDSLVLLVSRVSKGLISFPQTWEDLFKMLDNTTNVWKRALADALTDPMTVLHAMREMSLLDNGDKNKVIRMHVVGAEPNEVEINRFLVFVDVISKFTGRKFHIVYIGPLLTSSSSGQKLKDHPEFISFRGTYQEYILTSEYEEADCIVAFFPGLYISTYNWLPVVFQAIAKKVPFLVTCGSKGDLKNTKEWLEGSGMEPIVHEYQNPFGSLHAIQHVPGSNYVKRRNLFCLLFKGGELHDLRRLLQVENEKEVAVQDLLERLGDDPCRDIIKLNKSGKM